MIKSKFKRVTSLFLATLMCVTTFAGIGSTTAYAASGEKADVYMVDFPRDGDANYDGVWGHSNLTLKNGWHTGRSNFTNLKAIGSYSGNVAYCIEPGISLKVGQTMNKYDENYFNNLAANGVISGDEIRLFVGRILQYGYRGTISTSWRSQNEAAANSIAQAYATQLLIWETVIGERDTNFNHVAASGCSNVKDVINAKHPLRNKIFSYYNSMVQSVQNHATIPSFCNKSSGSAKTIELEWNGSKYTTTLTDSNNVLSKYNFKASISGVSFSVNGNKLTVSMDTAPSKEFTITATKKNAVRRGVVVWSEGKHGQNSSVQDVVSYAQEVSDSINGYVKMKVSYGSCQIVKTSEDGKVDGINFTITVQRNYVVKLKGETSRDVPLGDDAHGNIVRIDNGIERFEEALADTKNSLENMEKQFETAKQEIEKPFAKEEELRAKTARLDELNILLNMDKKENEIVGGEPDEGEPVGGRKEKSYER